MKKSLIILLFVALTSSVQAQFSNWAVGFRIGEPSGLNVRKYFGSNHAFDLNVGTYGGLYGNTRAYRSGQYKSVGLSFQGHYLWHTELFNKPEFHGYYGFGGQVNVRNYYPDNLATLAVTSVSETSLGGSAVAGLEYFVPSKPYSIFLETGLYAEVLPVPFYFNIQSGLGIRFNL
jgi:hypothetical protein